MTMIVIPPIQITPDMVISTTATEPHDPAAFSMVAIYSRGQLVKVTADYAIYESLGVLNLGNTPSTSPLWWRKIGPTETLYNSGTVYPLGATVYSSTAHRCYESLQAANTGNPLPVLPETETDFWIDIGPTNAYAMFDLERNTQTVVDGTLTVVVTPGQRINSLCALGMAADNLVESGSSAYGGGVVHSNTRDLVTREVLDGYDYSFAGFDTVPSFVTTDIPAFSDISMTLTLTRNAGGGNVKCGSFVVGSFVELGTTVASAVDDAVSFSTVTRDIYGTATLVKRRAIPKNDYEVRIPKYLVRRARAIREYLNATPAVWLGITDDEDGIFESLLILGIAQQFSFRHDLPDYSIISLRLEEI